MRECHLAVYGAHPTFIICSATVANPREHAQVSQRLADVAFDEARQFLTWPSLTWQELVGLREVEEVTVDGSPCGDKAFVFWNPPIVALPPVCCSTPSLLSAFSHTCVYTCVSA